MIPAKELKEWAATLGDNTGVAVDDGGLCLVEISDSDGEIDRLEVGGIPEEEESNFEVIVGNIGCVYSCNDRDEAETVYNECVHLSQTGHGRAADDSVTLLHLGEIFKEHPQHS